ncbi:unnamed protein product [Pseudo-nitzschia multistriata]|uniref:Plastid light harvesting protein n=1 Tax=Pseudo-nitzschia multistriata TaxID=183589 RepID=A0A448ZD41_9STRA|nr:unnamed protein product [Pseudo-nitzschia multistriata]
MNTMKLTLILSSITASVTAFSVSKSCSSKSTVLKNSPFENEIGAQQPLGFFDPLGLLDEADATRFNRLRYVELKHGRISMLAVVGHIVTTGGVRLPGDIDYHGTSFESIPSGLAAISKIPTAGLLQIFLFVGLLELGVMKDITGDGETVGDFRNDFLDFGWDTFTPEEKERKLAIELNNGRAAQMGILGMMVHEMLPSHDPYMINGFAGSPIDFNAGF